MTLDAKKKGYPKTFVSNPIISVSNPQEFNKRILKGRTQQFQSATEIEESHVFYDRALPDVLAYMDFFDQHYGPRFIEACNLHIYDHVFLLPPWEEIYISDNERLESFDEALQLHGHLERIYVKFGYTPITVPKDSVEERLAFILKELNTT